MNTNFWYSSFLPNSMLMNCKNVNRKKLNSFKNRIEAQNMFMTLWNLALNRYVWELPETCDARFLETQALLGASACMYNDKMQGFQTLGFLPREFNVYGNPRNGSCFGFFGGVKNCECYIKGSFNDTADAVVLWDNNARYPFINYLITYSERLADLMRSMDTAAWLLQVPYIVTCEQSQENTFKAFFDKVDQHLPYIPVSNALNPESIQTLNLNPNPQVVESLWIQYKNIESEIKTRLGLSSNPAREKKERLTVDEVNESEEITNDYIYSGLEMRKQFCEDVRDAFGINISVKVNEAIEYKTEEEPKELEKNEIS